jgi:hypothetical protein
VSWALAGELKIKDEKRKMKNQYPADLYILLVFACPDEIVRTGVIG